MRNDIFKAIVKVARLNRGRRWAILDFIDDYSRDFPWLPDLRDICDGVGISSTSVAQSAMASMFKADLLGSLTLPSGHTAPRTVHLTDLGREVLAHYKKINSGRRYHDRKNRS